MERLAINRDWRELYDRYIHESEKQKVSYQEFVEINGNPGYTVRDITIESIALDGESAIATLITTRCYSSDCDGPNQKMVRRRLRFEYINGRWYRPMNILVYCTRSEPYPIVPEFERAISLIEQR